jgi:hypothetical protein
MEGRAPSRIRARESLGQEISEQETSGQEISGQEISGQEISGQEIATQEWQANSMDQPVDEHTTSDLCAIAEARQLTASQCNMLARNVTGALRPNRDIYLWVLANVLSAVLLCGHRRQHKTFDPADCALEIVLAAAPERRAALTRLCAGHEDVRITGEGIAVNLDSLQFEASFARIDDALAFGDFFITGSDGALFASFKEAVLALTPVDGTAAPPQEAVGILSRRIAQWRRERLPLGRQERLFTALVGFLLKRPTVQRRHGLLAFDDDDIVAFWRTCVEAGERLMFRTAVERFRDFGRLVKHLNALRSLARADDLDALAARIETQSDADWNATADDVAEVRLLGALKGLPDDPNALKGVECDMIATLAALMPFHKERPGSVLRVLAFGPVQSGIANRLRRGGGGPEIDERVGCGDAQSYDAVADRFYRLRDHLDGLRRIAVALRFGDKALVRGVDPDALAEVVQQGNAALRRLRRAGFDRPRAELAAVFAGIDGTLSDFCTIVCDFTAEIDRLGERRALSDRFTQDKPVFIEILTRAYLARQETRADV